MTVYQYPPPRPTYGAGNGMVAIPRWQVLCKSGYWFPMDAPWPEAIKWGQMLTPQGEHFDRVITYFQLVVPCS